MLDRETKRQLEGVLTFMQRNDPNGDYITYLEDIEAGSVDFEEAVLSLIGIIRQWKKDLCNSRDPKHKGLEKQQLVLAGMI